MKGNNKMELNHATLNEAVSYWLNKTQFRYESEVEVTSIKYLTTGNGAFKVEFRRPVAKAEDDK